MKKENGVTSDTKQIGGNFFHKIHIKAKGDKDEHCEGKYVWDEVVRTLIFRIFDIKVNA
jgi:hypothetical protein